MAVAALHACGTTEEQGGFAAGPTLLPLDTVLLAENDSVFVGVPTGFAVAEDGTYLIPDLRNHTVHQYAPDGTHLRSLGRRGGGPDEFGAIGGLVADGDSLLLVRNGANVKLFDYRSGELRWERLMPGRLTGPPNEPTAARNARFFFRVIDRDRRASVGVISTASDTPALGGPFPELLARARVVGDLFSFLHVVPLGGDSIAVAMTLSDHLFVGPFAGPFEAIPIPAVRRRGARTDLLDQIRDGNPETIEAAWLKPSHPHALARLPSGNIVYVTAELKDIGGRFALTLNVSIIDPVRRRSCVDAEIPAPDDPPPWAAFRGDTLLVLIQDVVDSTATTVIRRSLVSTENCRWRTDPLRR